MAEKEKDNLENLDEDNFEISGEELVEENNGLEKDDEENKILENEIARLNDQLVLMSSDFMNYKRRTEKEKKDTIKYAIDEFALALVAVVDNFERAMETQTDKTSSFYEGIVMIHSQLIKVLNDNGVKKMEAAGEVFDPTYYQAVGVVEGDKENSGKVVDVLFNGYMIYDRVLRPATVRVYS